MAEKTLEEELEWFDERFVKSMARINYLRLIELGYTTGYDILQHMKGHFKLKLSAAAVYPVLQCLESDGYTRGEWVKGKHPSKKKYALTPKGRKLLTAWRRRMHKLVDDIINRRAENGCHR
ncbi:MAG: PadR family transcriptional regulator [Candidatus Altiarchaeota archaeon]